MIVTISSAMCSWLSIMNVPIARIRPGTIAVTTLPVGVSPMSFCTTPATAPASAAATTKISTATMMFGRNACTCAMNVVSAGIFSAPIAADSANRKMNQYAVAPMRCDGRAPGLIRSTY